jgi:hypothetical protein
MAEMVGSELMAACRVLGLSIDLRRSIEDNRFKLRKNVIFMACPAFRP